MSSATQGALIHRHADLNGLRWHYVESGRGPLLLLLHGFPYTWYEFRHLIPRLAGAYRVVAPDLPGFGDSDAPAEDARYTHVRLTGDLVGLMKELRETRAILLGHDIGASLAFAAAQMRPDLFRALVIVSTAQAPRDAQRPSVGWEAQRRQTGGMSYRDYFTRPEAIRELDADIRRSLRAIMVSVSGSAAPDARWRSTMQPGEGFLDTVHDPDALPAWLPGEALEHYVAQYAKRGFAGPLAYYRVRDLNWELAAFLDGRAPPQPALFVGGAVDPAMAHLRSAYDRLEATLPHLAGKPLVAGAGHGLPEEAPEALVRHLIDFLATPGVRKAMDMP